MQAGDSPAAEEDSAVVYAEDLAEIMENIIRYLGLGRKHLFLIAAAHVDTLAADIVYLVV